MNGTSQSNGADPRASTQRIHRALEIVYNARSTNSERENATQYLEALKSDQRASCYGFELASTRTQPTVVRYFGLSLIDHTIRFRWSEYGQEESKALRDWTLRLAHNTSSEDPAFITNKVAEIWVELAKRSWALDWTNLDENLVQLWAGDTAQRNLVLVILTTLSEEIFTIEDTVVALRDTELNKACVDIFTPLDTLTRNFPNRENKTDLRHGSEGWVARMANALTSCMVNGRVPDGYTETVLKILYTYKSIVNWIIPNALVVTNSLAPVFSCLEVGNVAIQLGSMETLYDLYYRNKLSDEDFQSLVIPVLESNTINLLSQLYKWLEVDPSDIDDAKYLLLKKFSKYESDLIKETVAYKRQMLYNIGRLLMEKFATLPESYDMKAFQSLLLDVARNESLQVSIPALHLWAKLLSVDAIATSPATLSLVGPLLELCSQRLVRYEAFPKDSSHPSILFLNEDIETIPERHAFLGNYSRFCNQIVELMVPYQPIDALYHVLGQADRVLEHAYDGEAAFHPSMYTKNSVPFLKIDASFSVIEAAMRGCLKWLTSSAPHSSLEHRQDIMVSNLEVWCDRLLGINFEDPFIKERVLNLSVGFAVGPLRRNPQFAVRLFDKILDTRCPSYPDSSAYTDAVKDLLGFCTHQMQRLAIKFADQLVSIFDEIEQKLTVVSTSVGSEPHVQARYSSILLIIMHRAGTIDLGPREARMRQMIQPNMDQWQDKALEASLSSLESFCRLLGLDGVQNYLVSHKAQNIEDWSLQPLDDEGLALQKRIQSAIDDLPLKATKSFLSATCEKLTRPSQPFDMAQRFWQSYAPFILPNLLRLMSYSQTYQNPSTWPGLTPEMAPTIRRMFTDRFWQVGISQGSRDEFYARIGGTKSTLEGLASSVRATLRTLRETGYKILYLLSLLGDYLYSIPGLPVPLANAIFGDARVLSAHQMSLLVEIIKPIIEGCPIQYRESFLPPMVLSLFEQVDQKTSLEWERIEARHRSAGAEDDLSTEMKEESILRQLTMASVGLVVALLDSAKPALSEGQTNGARSPPATTRQFILETPEVLKPIILFCTHALRMRDTRACTQIAKVFGRLVPEFTGDNPVHSEVREYISTEVLKASITSLNDPYFVEMQRVFAQLIASILVSYNPRTATPGQILLSLPGMTQEKADRAISHLYRSSENRRQQRAVVLQLLEAYRGMTIDQQGKLPRLDHTKIKSEMQAKYTATNVDATVKKEGSPDLGGMAELFGP